MRAFITGVIKFYKLDCSNFALVVFPLHGLHTLIVIGGREFLKCGGHFLYI